MKTIKLGYAVGTGEEVQIPLRHMVVAGQTQEAGKTTTLEALISRSQLPAVAFVTKRGERAFSNGRRVEPFLRERADWQFVASVLEATMRERLKFERAWIIRASKGASSLADVQGNVRRLMATAKGMSADVYLTLDSYLDIVVPRVASIDWADRLTLQPGLNVVDLSDRDQFPPELQSLVMRSALEWVYERENGTVTIIPEAWEFIPQGRGSPVKLAAVELIRKGAGLANYVWLDSQDIGGIDKELLRSCPVWLLGVQRETNEIKRTLDNIPAGVARPKPADVATLERGQFFACWGKHVVKTYVQPAWVTDKVAASIATGLLGIEASQLQMRPNRPPPPPPPKRPTEGAKPMSDKLEKKVDALTEAIGRLVAVQAVPPGMPTLVAVAENSRAAAQLAKAGDLSANGDEDTLFQRFRAWLLQDPVVLQVLATRSELRVEVERRTITIDGSSVKGRVARLFAGGFFDDTVTFTSVRNELRRTGTDVNNNTLSGALKELVVYGFLTKEGSEGYKAVEGMKAQVVKKA